MIAASGCSTLNPDFDLVGEETVADTVEPTSAATTAIDSSGETGDVTTGGVYDVPAENVCAPILVDLIEECLHYAELSRPMETEFATTEYHLRPIKADLMTACTSGGVIDGWTGDVFLSMLVGGGSGVDPAEAYYQATCGNSEHPWCEGSVDEFRSEELADCFMDFSRGFTFRPFTTDDGELEGQIAEVKEGYFANDCAGLCENQLEIWAFDPTVAPTAGGDAVREMLGSYVLGNGVQLTRYDNGVYTDAPFEIALSGLYSAFGAEDWIAVLFISHGESDGCADLQHRVLLTVHHEMHLVIKIIQTQCVG